MYAHMYVHICIFDNILYIVKYNTFCNLTFEIMTDWLTLQYNILDDNLKYALWIMFELYDLLYYKMYYIIHFIIFSVLYFKMFY